MTTVELPPSGEPDLRARTRIVTCLLLLPRAQTGIISNSTFTKILKSCNFSDVGPFVTGESKNTLLPKFVMSSSSSGQRSTTWR